MLRRIALMLAVALPMAIPFSRASAQVLTPGEQIRVTARSVAGSSRTTGRLISMTPDTITLRPSGKEPIGVARADVVRLERRRNNTSVGKAGAIGCAAGGAALGGFGLMLRDPDSPGIERTLAGVGLVVGCLAGGTVGLIGGIVARGPWVEVSVPAGATRN